MDCSRNVTVDDCSRLARPGNNRLADEHASDVALFAILQIVISISLMTSYPKKHIQAIVRPNPRTIIA